MTFGKGFWQFSILGQLKRDQFLTHCDIYHRSCETIVWAGLQKVVTAGTGKQPTLEESDAKFEGDGGIRWSIFKEKLNVAHLAAVPGTNYFYSPALDYYYMKQLMFIETKNFILQKKIT